SPPSPRRNTARSRNAAGPGRRRRVAGAARAGGVVGYRSCALGMRAQRRRRLDARIRRGSGRRGSGDCTRHPWRTTARRLRAGPAGTPRGPRGTHPGARPRDTPAGGMGLPYQAVTRGERMRSMSIGIDPGVLVVGAGPTGLVAAIELARRGERVSIIDRDAGPTPLSRAVGIAAHSLELLEPAGVTERLLARGRRIGRVRVH